VADILKFRARQPPSGSAYRLYRFATDGSVRETVVIRSRTDAVALRKAHRLADGTRSELWLNERFVDHILQTAHPVAVSIRVLPDSDRPANAKTRLVGKNPVKSE